MSTTAPVEVVSRPARVKSTAGVESKQSVWAILLPYVIIIAAQLPLVVMYFKSLWETRPHYQFFPLAFIAVAVFLYMRWPKSATQPFRRSRWSVFYFSVGVFFALLATLFVTPWFAYFSTVCLAASLLVRTRDLETGKTLLPIILPLVVLIQPPVGLDFETVHGDRLLITQLQTTSSIVTSNFLDLIGYRHHLMGHAIHTPERPDHPYAIEEGCSGVQSFFTLLFCTAVFVVWMRRPLLRAILLLIAAVFWAVLMNTVRIVVIPLAQDWFGLDLAGGVAHELWGYVALLIGVLLVASTDQLLYFLLGPVSADSLDPLQRSRRRIAVLWNRFVAGTGATTESGMEFGEAGNRRQRQAASPTRAVVPVLWGFAVLMIVMFVLQTTAVAQSIAKPTTEIRFFDNDVVVPMQQESLPPQIGSWQMIDYKFEVRSSRSDLGARSDAWVYRLGENSSAAMQVSFDQPFPGWHELTGCYRGGGWQMTRRIIQDHDTPWPYVEAEFRRPTGERAFLVFALFDRVGEPFEPPHGWNNFEALFLRIRNRMSHRIRTRLFRGEAYQIQSFFPYIETDPEILDAQKAEVVSAFLEIRETMRSHFAELHRNDSPRPATESGEIAAAK